MGTSNYSDEFKRDAVHQVTVRGYQVREVSRRPGVSTHSLHNWIKRFGEPMPKPDVDHEVENRHLKRELAWVAEERDILKKMVPFFAIALRTMVECPRRELLPALETGTDQAADTPNVRRCKAGCVRRHRDVLQPKA